MALENEVNDYMAMEVSAPYAALFLPGLEAERWEHIQGLTEHGLNKGVKEFLTTIDADDIDPSNVYEFYFDRTTETTIADRLRGSGFQFGDVKTYAEDMSEGFATYVLRVMDGKDSSS